MGPITRRCFLRSVGVAGAGLALARCAPRATTLRTSPRIVQSPTGVSARFQAITVEAYDGLPTGVRTAFSNRGCDILLTRAIADEIPTLGLEALTATDIAWLESTVGLYRRGRIWVAEYSVQSDTLTPSHDPANALRHEVGHAVDELFADTDARRYVSASPQYQLALSQDLQDFRGAAARHALTSAAHALGISGPIPHDFPFIPCIGPFCYPLEAEILAVLFAALTAPARNAWHQTMIAHFPATTRVITTTIPLHA